MIIKRLIIYDGITTITCSTAKEELGFNIQIIQYCQLNILIDSLIGWIKSAKPHDAEPRDDLVYLSRTVFDLVKWRWDVSEVDFKSSTSIKDSPLVGWKSIKLSCKT